MKKKRKAKPAPLPKSILVRTDGPLCRRCGLPTNVMGHPEGWTPPVSQKGYLQRWFECTNSACNTTLIPDWGSFVTTNKEPRKDHSGRFNHILKMLRKLTDEERRKLKELI